MALLTTDEIIKKTFDTVRFRDGYEQSQVDEFLDEITETIYVLQLENTELKEELEAARLRIKELEAGAPVEVVAAPVAEEVAPAAPVVEEVAPVAEEVSAAPAVQVHEDASSMLALAQRVHDDYVREGREQSEKIIAQAHAQSDIIVREAEDKRNDILSQLESDRNLLEGKINELKSFEADYRNRMREHLQHLLGEL
ncbi:DivIVA domain-containing protein [Gleimia sp. 6138-11-ORH1]|uniref:DivIVA domain-containing protein n=1 Tax=Gleimia sp. 6138-11-ORH1 TaxID=2973937 RepID=UPI002167107B|nr:DivIVA domain-containing protein [Gleimia sp. 6138-11-ORH1]MCS4484532.1 DivIVA domain-containing protein [Gleimia sp. 6138-11-ORH1]